MTAIINRADAPAHLFLIPELDFSGDLFSEQLDGSWFRLGAWTIKHRRDVRGVEAEVSRQTMLLAPDSFAHVFDKLESVGNVLRNLGKPLGTVHQSGEEKDYRYTPFHRFEFSFSPELGEPLVFTHSSTSGVQLMVNPDLWMFFELEEKGKRGSGIWWDPRRGVDAILQHVVDQDHVEVVEIRADYLLKYLQARQMFLLVAHYCHLHLFDPSPDTIQMFVEGDLVLGSPEQGAKAVLQNRGLRNDIPGFPFLQRRLHLWYEIRPPGIDVDDPWTEQPSFDPYAFTLPTRVGVVAPARWKNFRHIEGRTFEGERCDYMDSVYFRQEVLTKYEGASGYDVADNGSVSCRHYWGLVRSTRRIGNELLSTAIGDFAEGVPFEEWPHWKQYAVEPPSLEAANALGQERKIADDVNSVVDALNELNTAFAGMAASLRVEIPDPLWRGSLDSLAGRQLKWVYPATADDDEFLTRATLASTLVLDALELPSLRKLLRALGCNLHMNDERENPPRYLNSRNLLQRTALVAALTEDFQVETAGISTLVWQAEGKAKNADPDLQVELEKVNNRVRKEFAPLAFLYDLRNSGGLAHAPNKSKAAAASVKLGLPEKNWHRTDYLQLLALVSGSLERISGYLDNATQLLSVWLSETQ